jgi:XTP/dITP diphosphohydrolase
MQKIVLASGNKGKLTELQALLSGAGFDLVSQSVLGLQEAEETGQTFIENAILKARFASKQSGLPALADDSGLAVDALGGAPGIYSARYSGEGATDQRNIELLLANMCDIPEAERGAQFHCVLVYLRHAQDPVPIVCHGVWCGCILIERRGEGGFGYDPVFWVPELSCSAAELSKADKNRISHRGQALAQLLAQLQAH